MLIDIFSGRDRHSALCKGSFHFSIAPSAGEQLELAGERFTVADAWHKPDIDSRGAMFAILVTDAVEPARQSGQLEKAGAFS